VRRLLLTCGGGWTGGAEVLRWLDEHGAP